jgi:pseudaminic acid biosynthesis-associated protein PseG
MAESSDRTVLLRADAGPSYGIGHAMRCRTLAQALAGRGLSCHFACAELVPSLRALLSEGGMVIHDLDVPRGSAEDAAATLALARGLSARAVVVDGYCFASAWRERVQQAALVLALDDLGDVDPLHADLVLNAAVTAHAIDYARIAPGAELLLGGAYTLVRREVATLRNGLHPLAHRPDWLVMMGGTDPLRLMLPLLAALAGASGGPRRILAALGGRHPDRAAIEALGEESAGRVVPLVDTFDLGPAMAEAGLAVTAGGSTLGELASLGVPSIVAVVADNQAPSASMLQEQGL